MFNLEPPALFRPAAAALAASLLLLHGARAATAEVTLYPGPGDLSAVEGLQQSKLFTLRVNGKEPFVYHSFEAHLIGTNRYTAMSGEGVSYCCFAFSGGPVTVEIVGFTNITRWKIGPADVDAKQIDARTLRLNLDRPRKIALKAMMGGAERYFILAADAPEVNPPTPGDPGVLYLPPGVHRFGAAWDPFTNGVKTLYVAGGAVVEATVKTRDKQDIQIRGRGLFEQAFQPHARRGWYSEGMGVYIRSCKRVTVEGIAVLSSPSFQMEFADCDDVVARNVKLCGFGENNNDGFHLYSRNVQVEDCFIAANDDRICITGLFDSDPPADRLAGMTEDERITDTEVGPTRIRKVVFWGLKNGGDIQLTWNGGKTLKNVIVEDCDSLDPVKGAFVELRHGGSVIIDDVLVRNCRVEHGLLFDLIVRGASWWGKGGGSLEGLTLQNIQISVPPREVGRVMQGHSPTSRIAGLVLRNVTAGGVLLTNLAQTSIETNGFVEPIRFEP